MRRIDWIAAALTGIGIWSIVGGWVAITLGDSLSAWRFLWSSIGAGLTLIAISFYRDRVDG